MDSASKIAASAFRQIAMDAAMSGACVARRIQLAGLKPRQKSADKGDLVTEGDEAAQEEILKKLPWQWDEPPHAAIGLLAEEKTAFSPPQEGVRWRWVVDPIDGTLPYSRGEPHWCVSIALQEKTGDDSWASRLAALYQASATDTAEQLKGKLFLAAFGEGATVLNCANGTLRPLEPPAVCAPLAELSAGGSFGEWAQQEFARRGVKMQFRRSICHAAAELFSGGCCAVVQDAGPLEWDVAAITLIAREAGAQVHAVPVDKPAGVMRYAVVMAWDKELFEQFRQRMDVL